MKIGCVGGSPTRQKQYQHDKGPEHGHNKRIRPKQEQRKKETGATKKRSRNETEEWKTNKEKKNGKHRRKTIKD